VCVCVCACVRVCVCVCVCVWTRDILYYFGAGRVGAATAVKVSVTQLLFVWKVKLGEIVNFAVKDRGSHLR
jgi:hypothetical protein